MEILIGILFIAALLFYANQRMGRGKPTPKARPAASPTRNAEDWIEECWRAEKDQGPTARPWFFDPVTDGQVRKLQDLKVDTRGMKLTKGMASDLIGMQLEPEEHDLEILKHFKVSTRGMNQAKARYEVAKIMAIPGNKEKWENRPADGMSKELYRLAGKKVPKDLSITQAAAEQQALYQSLGADKQALWDALNELWDEVWDPYFTEEYETRRPSASAVRKAVEAMLAEGTGLDEVDLDGVMEKIDDMKDTTAVS